MTIVDHGQIMCDWLIMIDHGEGMSEHVISNLTMVVHGQGVCDRGRPCNDNYLYYTYSNTCFIIMLYRLHIVYSCIYFAGHMNGGRWASLLLAYLIAAFINPAMSGMQYVCELCLK